MKPIKVDNGVLQTAVASFAAMVTTVATLSFAPIPAAAQSPMIQWITPSTTLTTDQPTVDLQYLCLEDTDSASYERLYVHDSETGERALVYDARECVAGEVRTIEDFRYSLPGGSRTLHVRVHPIYEDPVRVSGDIVISRAPYQVSAHVSRSGSRSANIVAEVDQPLDDSQVRLWLARDEDGDAGPKEPVGLFWESRGYSVAFEDLSGWEDISTGNHVWYYQFVTSDGSSEMQRIDVLEYGSPQEAMSSGSNPDGPGCQGCAADPINTSDGTYFDTWTDLTVAGRGPALQFVRHYSTSDTSNRAGLGHGWSHNYAWELDHDQAAGTATVTDERGNRVVFTEQGGDWMGPAFIEQNLESTTSGWRLERLRDGLYYDFDSQGRLVAIVDRAGESLSLTYAGDQLASVSGQSGQSLTVTWDGDLISSVSDHTGRTVELTHSAEDDLIGSEGGESSVWEHTYDSAHLMLEKTDGEGGSVTNQYDSQGRVTSQANPLGGVTTFSYQAQSGGGARTTTTLPDGTRFMDDYVDGLRLKRERSATSTGKLVTSWVYDPDTLSPIRVSKGNSLVRHEVDDRGRPTKTIDPAGASTSYSWNGRGQLTGLVTADGGVTTFGYDTSGNLISRTEPSATGPATTNWAYGDAQHPSDVTGIIDADGEVAAYTYDSVGNLSTATDRTGRTTTFDRDGLGRVITVTANDGTQSSATYNDANRLLGSTTSGVGTTTHVYDNAQRLIEVTDAAGSLTTIEYDSAGNVIESTTGGVTRTSTYDTAERLIARGDGDGNETTYGYSYSGAQPESSTDPAGNSTAYRWTSMGQLARLDRPGSNSITYTYDDAGRRIEESAGGSGYLSTTWAYDQLGRRTEMIDSTGATSYEYDEASNLVSVDAPGTLGDIEYTYDVLNRQVGLSHSAGDISRTFDAEGRMLSLSDIDGSSHSWTYDLAGNLSSHTRPGGTTTSYERDSTQRVTSLSTESASAAILDIGYAWDSASKIDTITMSGTGAMLPGTENLSHDPAGRLTVDGDGAYGWDASGNLSGFPAHSTRVFDDAGRLESVTRDGQVETLAWSESGSLIGQVTTAGETSFNYDSLERLTEHTSPGGTTTSYMYDGDGLRVGKEVGASAIEEFGWDITGPAESLLIDGAYAYTHGPTGLIAAHELGTSSSLYPVTDLVGSVVAWVDDAGTVQGKADYTSYGERTTSGIVIPFGFAGQYHDSETGLIHLRARYLDPSLGIFTSLDPLAETTRDGYNYASGDPSLYTDPTGELAWLAPLATAAVGAVAGGVTSGASALLAGEGWASAGRAAAGGAVEGGITGACAPLGALGMAGCSAAGSVAGTGVEHALGNDKTSSDYVTGAAFSGATGAVGQGFMRLWRHNRMDDVEKGWESIHGQRVAGGRIRLLGEVKGEVKWDMLGYGFDAWTGWGLRETGDC